MERNSPILFWSHPRFLQRFARIFVPKASFSPFPWQLTSTHTHTQFPSKTRAVFHDIPPPTKKPSNLGTHLYDMRPPTLPVRPLFWRTLLLKCLSVLDPLVVLWRLWRKLRPRGTKGPYAWRNNKRHRSCCEEPAVQLLLKLWEGFKVLFGWNMWPWGGFEIIICVQILTYTIRFFFRHHLFLNWWSWFAWFVDFFKRFPNQKMANQKFRHRFRNPANLDIGVCLFFFRCLWLPRMARSTVGAWARSRESRWQLRVFQTIFLVLKIEWKIVEVWRCLLFLFVVFHLFMPSNFSQTILEQMWRDFKKEGFRDVLIFLIHHW